jgi:hypothetical protein
MTVRSSCRRAATLIVATSSSLILLAAQAQARPESFRWLHPDPDRVSGFEARVRPLSGETTQTVQVPVSNPDSGGIFRYSIEVGDGDQYISLRAIGTDGTRSNWSGEQLRTDPNGIPGPAPEPEPGDTFDPGTPLTPTPGATNRFDFSDSSPGSTVPSWVDTQANYSLLIQGSLFGVVELGSNRVLHTSSNDRDIHSHATGNDHIWSDYELRGRLAIDDANGAIGVTTMSQFTDSARYYRLGRSAGGAFVIEGHPNSLPCAPSANPVNPNPGSWYRFKFDVQRMATSNQIRAKIWREGTSEPSGYALSCVDSSSSRPSGGRIGVWSSGSGQKYWDDFEVITANDSGGGGTTPAPPAPVPPILISVELVEP